MTTITHRHHWIVRATHWVNAIAFVAMAGSGLRIFNAYPAFARRGETFALNPWEGTPFPAWLTFGGWLGGARHWHFAMMWVLVLNAVVYLTFIYLHGEWRDLVPRRGTLRDAWSMIRFYLWLEKEHPRQGKHNALQRMAYFSMPWMAALIVITGIAIWKPVSLGWLTALFGGYAYARFFHFAAMVALLVAALGHVFMVFAVDPYSLRAIITGAYDESRSPEARNAHPFVNLRPGRTPAVPPSPASAAAPTSEPDA